MRSSRGRRVSAKRRLLGRCYLRGALGGARASYLPFPAFHAAVPDGGAAMDVSSKLANQIGTGFNTQGAATCSLNRTRADKQRYRFTLEPLPANCEESYPQNVAPRGGQRPAAGDRLDAVPRRVPV